MPELLFPGEKVLVIHDAARLDEAARLAFLGGHCHSLALALHERTGWPLIAIDHRSDGVCAHVAVQRPDGKVVDIAGAHTVEQINDSRIGGTIIREITASEIDELHKRDG